MIKGESDMKKSSNPKRRTRRKSSVSEAGTYAAMGDFWDEHDLSDYWSKTRPARADVDLESEESLYAVEKGLSETIRREAKERGVSPHTLVNLWLQEKVQKLKLHSRRG
jgi:hypothetical protein